MRILQINTADIRGGAAKVAYRLSKGLEKIGHQTSMFVGQKFSSDENVFLFNDKKSFSMRLRKKLAYYLANDIDLFSSDKILKTKEFKEANIIHCHNLHSYYFNLNTLKKISRLKPIIWTFHDMWPITPHCGHAFAGEAKNGFFQCPSLDIFPPIAWHNEKYLERRKKDIYDKSKFHIVTPSKWLADKVGQSILKNKPITVIYNGVDTSIFRPHGQEDCRRFLGLPLNKRIILIVAKGGRSNPWKGSDYAQDVIASIDDPMAFFVDLGGDTNQDSYRVKTVSYTSDQETLTKYYSAADILLYPSIADNCPLVILEAQACGLPVVSFDTGGIPELVEHKKTGYIADYKNLEDLKQGVNFMLSLPDNIFTEFKNRSISNTLQKFTLEIMTDKYLEIYKKELGISGKK